MAADGGIDCALRLSVAAAGDCFVFKTGPASTYPNSTGIVRFERVEGSRDSFTGNNALPNDKPCYILISIKTQVVE